MSPQGGCCCLQNWNKCTGMGWPWVSFFPKTCWTCFCYVTLFSTLLVENFHDFVEFLIDRRIPLPRSLNASLQNCTEYLKAIVPFQGGILLIELNKLKGDMLMFTHQILKIETFLKIWHILFRTGLIPSAP